MPAKTGCSASRRQIDLDKAIRVALPSEPENLKPTRLTAPDGLRGWSVHLPSKRPIATPAYEDGLLFVGGGYGSYEFYAFDAKTGEVVWRIKTADDGPTAAVVEQGLVAFNTESCTVVVCEARSGRIIWEEWLGDPLMGQPAIAGDRLFIAYPAEQRKPLFRPGMDLDQRRRAIKQAKEAQGGRQTQHRLLCAALRTGEHLWEQEISGDAISAPVVNGDCVFLTCFDGTSYCLRVDDGTIVWKRENAGTSAPFVVGGEVLSTEKETEDGSIFERMRRSQRHDGDPFAKAAIYGRKSEYLTPEMGGGSSLRFMHAMKLDANVGFANAPSSARLEAARRHLGVGTVSGAWAYQGSRCAYVHGRVFNAQGSCVYRTMPDAGEPDWEAEASGRVVDADDRIFLPPALGHERVYLTSILGHALSLQQDNGEIGVLYDVQEPIAFQPCLAAGRMCFGTNAGRLVCLEIGDDADGWYMWGGNAQHNLVR